MKNNILQTVIGISVFASIAISCNNTDIVGSEEVSIIDPANFQGKIASGTTLTLDPSLTYHLTGKLQVESGATLIIPAGTHIVGEFGATYIIVDRGAKIFVNGTASKPVLFDGANHNQGYWGGLVLLGNAPTNRSAIGTSTSELGDLTYGGNNNNDSSGSISYCIIKDTGFKYNPEKEFNGLSLFGCGSGTTVSYLYVENGADDGIESFGGSPKYDHIVIIGNQDDSFDWTEGFSGSVNYIYSSRNKIYQTSSDPGNRGIEADTQDTDPNTTNGNGASNPTITNGTFIGNPAGSESQAFKLRAGSQGKFDNIVISNFTTGLDFETDRSFSWFNTSIRITNIKFVNVNTLWKAKSTITNPTPNLSGAFTINPSATGAGNGTALPTWAQGWTGLSSWDTINAFN